MIGRTESASKPSRSCASSRIKATDCPDFESALLTSASDGSAGAEAACRPVSAAALPVANQGIPTPNDLVVLE